MQTFFGFLREKKIIVFGIADTLFIVIGLFLAFLARFDGSFPPEYTPWFPYYALILVVLNITFLWRARLYAFTWGFVGFSEFVKLVKAITYAHGLFAIFVFIYWDRLAFLAGFPRSVIVISYLFDIAFLGVLRISKRFILEFRSSRTAMKSGSATLVVGAGAEGEQILRFMKRDTSFKIIGIIDNDPRKKKSQIHNVTVLGAIKDIPAITEKFSVTHVIIAIPAGNTDVIREAVTTSRDAGITDIKIIPTAHELLSGKVTIADLREVRIEDLLGRAPAKINTDEISAFIKEKTVLVTGAAGSIGSEIVRQCITFEPKKLYLLDFNESGLFDLEQELAISAPQAKKFTQSVIANITHKEKIDKVFLEMRPDVVFHAAAYKHVPLMEDHPEEAILTNVVGTMNIGSASIAAGVKKFVIISTDKAIRPISVMGKSKRAAELVLKALNTRNTTKFIAVRFGNVIGSRGSVIPLFQEQIRKRSPITVTHPDMTRYFMTIPEAALLVMEAGAVGNGGEVFMLDMGQPVKILEVARTLIRLAGLTPDVDIPIVFTGVRPGEKIEEIVFSEEEKRIGTTQWDKIFITKDESIPDAKRIIALTEELRRIIEKNHEETRKDLDAFIG